MRGIIYNNLWQRFFSHFTDWHFNSVQSDRQDSMIVNSTRIGSINM